jgi:hypothetical protein
MRIPVDYKCESCSYVFEARVPSPFPSRKPCALCGGEARRMYAAVGLLSPQPAPGSSTASSNRPGPSGGGGQNPASPDCRFFRDVPGLCHMPPSVARAWSAKARGDNRALERELARQESVPADQAVPATASHHHGHHRPQDGVTTTAERRPQHRPA